MGKPLTAQRPRCKFRAVKLTPKLDAQLEQYCTASERTRSEVIREAVRKLLAVTGRE